MIEHPEPRLPLLVEQHPVELVVERPLEIGEAPGARGEAAVDPATAVPVRVGMGHRRRDHGGHRAHEIRVGHAGRLEVEDDLAGLGQSCRPVFHRVLGSELVREPREAHRLGPRRPEIGGGRVSRPARGAEPDFLRVLLQEVPDADGHAVTIARQGGPPLCALRLGERSSAGDKVRGEPVHACRAGRTPQRRHARRLGTGLEQGNLSRAADVVDLRPRHPVVPPGAFAPPGGQAPIARLQQADRQPGRRNAILRLGPSGVRRVDRDESLVLRRHVGLIAALRAMPVGDARVDEGVLHPYVAPPGIRVNPRDERRRAVVRPAVEVLALDPDDGMQRSGPLLDDGPADERTRAIDPAGVEQVQEGPAAGDTLGHDLRRVGAVTIEIQGDLAEEAALPSGHDEAQRTGRNFGQPVRPLVVPNLDPRHRRGRPAHAGAVLDQVAVGLPGEEEDPHPLDALVRRRPRADLGDLRWHLAAIGRDDAHVLRRVEHALREWNAERQRCAFDVPFDADRHLAHHVLGLRGCGPRQPDSEDRESGASGPDHSGTSGHALRAWRTARATARARRQALPPPITPSARPPRATRRTGRARAPSRTAQARRASAARR